MQSQITNLSNSQSSSLTEVENLKRRVEDTDREKRELISVVSRMKDEGSQRQGVYLVLSLIRAYSKDFPEEIHTLRANLKEARQEHQTLEAQVRELRSAETAIKVRRYIFNILVSETPHSSKLTLFPNNFNFLKQKLNAPIPNCPRRRKSLRSIGARSTRKSQLFKHPSTR